MTLEDIKKDLYNIYNENNNIKIIELIKKIDEEERQKINIKTNGKNKINAINKTIKEVEKMGRVGLLGWSPLDDGFVFTNTYYIMKLKSAYNFPEAKSPLENSTLDRLLNYYEFNSMTKVPVDLKGIILLNKNKEKTLVISENTYNVAYLKNIIDIMGEKVTFYIDNDQNINFKNELGEYGKLLKISTPNN